MADLALSLTTKAVEGTVSRVLVAIEEENKQKAAAQEHLRFIVDEFQMMQSFLKVAKSKKQHTSNEVAKTWVRQLRELAFDVEDCVEFVINLDTTSHRCPWVWRALPWLLSCICMTPPWAGDLDKAVADLKQLRARVEEVSQRNTRYNLLSGDDSGSSSTTPPPTPPEQLDTASTFPSTVDILRDLWMVNSKQSTSLKCNLKYLVADGRCNELRVISVWRAAGVDLEAAHILNAAYLDLEICEKFEARARVKLMHPFNIQEFLKSLLNQLYVTSPQQDTLGEDLPCTKGDSVIQDKVKQLLSKHKYLVILEDLSSAVEWDLIRLCLPDRQNGSRIVVSTQQLGIALSCTGEPYRVLQLALLPNDRYIYAFYKPSGIDITELVKQLGQRRVISLWGDKGDDTASLVRDVFKAIKSKSAKFEGVKFDNHWIRWIDVPSQFRLEDFCQRMPDYRIDDYIDCLEKYFKHWSSVARWNRCLVVMEGLQSKDHWDQIKAAGGLVPKDTKSCIVIIANEEEVAKYCEDDSWRSMDDEEREEAENAAIIGPLFAQKVEEKYYSWGHDSFGGHGCSRRIDESLFKFEPLITADQFRVVENIIDWRIKDYGVHAVWGATGVGKSALVRFCYYTVMAHSLKLIKETKPPIWEKLAPLGDKGRFERFGWVDVPEPFDLTEFSRRLLLDFNSSHLVEMEKTAVDIIQGHNPIQRCYETIHKKKSLVVIDGLRSARDWESIKQAFWGDHHPESCIIVITIEETIAKHCVNNDWDCEQRIISVRTLDEKSAFKLFEEVVAYQNANRDEQEEELDERITEQKLKHAKRIVPKCGGLPKIIDAVAKSDDSFWENRNDDLVTKLKNGSQFGHLKGVLSWMHSYIDGRSDSVKPCIFYLSVFPTNYKIRKTHLLRRWIAEGYCRDTNGCSAKENAESLFDQLFDQDIIQCIESMKMWQVNGFFREYIISQPMEDNLVFALEGQCKPDSQRAVQHLTIMKDWMREKHVFESIDVSRLRSLTVYGKWKPFFISDKMKRIRVLDLEGTSGVEDCCLEHIFDILLSLKLICLRGCKSITCLPKTLGRLRQLESLDVSGTSIVTLPQAITKLQKIQYIRMGRNVFPEQPSGTTDKQGSDGALGSQHPSETTPRQAEGSDGSHEGEGQHQHHKQRYHNIKKVDRRCTYRLSSGLSSLLPCSLFDDNNGGVQVPKGIEDMPALHTLGTVNIKSAKDFLAKLKDETKLPQLLKLSLCGINKDNWQDLCDVLSARHYLQFLSVVLDEDLTEDICLDNPPKALESLEVHATWIKDGRLKVNLQNFDIEKYISIYEIVQPLPRIRSIQRIYIKRSRHVRELEFKEIMNNDISRPLVLQIVDYTPDAFTSYIRIVYTVKKLIIHRIRGPDFRISSNEASGLNNLLDIVDEVCLIGFYEDELEEDVAQLKERVAAHPRKPLFKFE